MGENISHDDHQDIARSRYADMLTDDERNRAFDEAIRICVAALVKSPELNPDGNCFFQCCDIGTGSGLLSMMIVRAFSDLNYFGFHVIAFETFGPMAECARNVIAINNMSQYITVKSTRSEQRMKKPPIPFSLLVAELLDTELIGEGCLGTYRHAITNLCSPNCLFVPWKARIYIEPVSSSFLFQRHAISDWKFNIKGKPVEIEVSEEVKNCCGLSATCDDLQASALKEGRDFIRVSEPKKIFEFTFNDLNTLSPDGHVEKVFPILRPVEQPIVLVMWWDIVMYDEHATRLANYSSSLDFSLEVLSCAPTWARSQDLIERDKKIQEIYGRSVWREHWMQAVYHFIDVPKTRQLTGLNPGSQINVHAHHDSHSLWFSLNCRDTRRDCSCGIHRAFSWAQLAFLSDNPQLMSLVTARLHNFDNTTKGTLKLRESLKGVNYGDFRRWKIQFQNTGDQPTNICELSDLSINDDAPWDMIFRRHLAKLSIEPIESFVIKCAQVQFKDLHRININIGKCEGFYLAPLDDLISESSKLVDKSLESHYLWEYDCEWIDTDYVVYSSEDSSDEDRDKITRGTFWVNIHLPIRNDDVNWKQGWALVFWAELILKGTVETLSTGPISLDPLEWNRYCQQQVYFLHDYPTSDGQTVVDLDVGFSNKKLTVLRAADYNSFPSSKEAGDN